MELITTVLFNDIYKSMVIILIKPLLLYFSYMDALFPLGSAWLFPTILTIKKGNQKIDSILF